MMPAMPELVATYTPAYNAQRTEQELFHLRRQIRDKCLGHPKVAELGGLLEEFHRRNAYSDEAMLGRIIAMYIEFMLSPALQLFDLAIKQSLMRGCEQTENLSIIYRKNAAGEYPPTYPLDENGKPDLTKPANFSKVDELLAWKNGYFPESRLSDPFTFTRMLSMCLADFTRKVLGPQTINELNKARLGLDDPHSGTNKAPVPPTTVTSPTAAGSKR